MRKIVSIFAALMTIAAHGQSEAPKTTTPPDAQSAGHGHSLGADGGQKESKIKYQTACPVDGAQARRECSADYKAMRIFFCSPACSKEFEKAPATYIEKLKGEGVVFAKVQTLCLVGDHTIDKSVYVDIQGVRIYFCSVACADIFKQNPSKYAEKSAKEGLVFDLSPPSAAHDHSGHNH